MVTETQFMNQGFRPEIQELSGRQTALNLGFLTGNPEIAGEIQILRQVFWMEAQISIIISSPVLRPWNFQVLHNIDELFDREELSAAPDAGWPDCFNSGVFVFRPSDETYASLLQFAVAQGSFDGEGIFFWGTALGLQKPLHRLVSRSYRPWFFIWSENIVVNQTRCSVPLSIQVPPC